MSNDKMSFYDFVTFTGWIALLWAIFLGLDALMIWKIQNGFAPHFGGSQFTAGIFCGLFIAAVSISFTVYKSRS